MALFALGSALAARAYVVLPPAPPGWLGYNIGGGIGAFRLAAIGVAAAHVGLSDAPERLWRTAPRNSSNGNTHGGRRMLTKDRDAPVDSSMI